MKKPTNKKKYNTYTRGSQADERKAIDKAHKRIVGDVLTDHSKPKKG